MTPTETAIQAMENMDGALTCMVIIETEECVLIYNSSDKATSKLGLLEAARVIISSKLRDSNE